MAKIYLFLTENRADMSSDEKVRAIVDAYFKRIGVLDRPPGDALLIAREEKGKPYFPQLPDVHFSVSHSGKYFACAFADVQIGLDIQECKNRPDEAERCIRIAKRFFHPDEIDSLEKSPVSAFYKIWTAKESYVKMTGQGIDGEFGDFCIFDLDCYLWQSEYGNCSIALSSEDICDIEIKEFKL